MEDIILGIIFVCAVLVVTCIIVLITWHVLTTPYFRYKLNKKTNKIQWRCEETWESRQDRLNDKSTDYECSLSYRVLPSELNKFVRIFGDNGWEYPFVEHLKFNNQDEFKKFVSNFVTYNDIRTWIDEKNCILWYEP